MNMLGMVLDELSEGGDELVTVLDRGQRHEPNAERLVAVFKRQVST
jgi:hypothetical protein